MPTSTLPTKATKIDFKFKGVDSSFAVEGIGEVQSEHIRNPVTGTPFEGYILLPDGINMRKSTVTNIRRWSLRDDAAGWDMARHAAFPERVRVRGFPWSSGQLVSLLKP